MGHRALYAREVGGQRRRRTNGAIEVHYLHWGALDAKYMGTEADLMLSSEMDKSPVQDKRAVVEWIDELYHECVYYESRHRTARAFVPVRLTTGVETDGQFALVELDEPDEWSEFLSMEYEDPLASITDEDAFVDALTDIVGADRIPEWSPLTPEQ